MLIKSIEFVQLELPFKSEFSHARKMRTSAGTILVRISTTQGIHGWGEILPRSYVTEETVDSIFDNQAHGIVVAALAQQLVGRRFSHQRELVDWIDRQLIHHRWHCALFGGVELALWNALHQSVSVDFDALVGPVNKRELGRCLTIGFETETASLRKQVVTARMSGATVIKLKVGLPDDIERLKVLDRYLNGKLPIRVDANGLYSVDQVEEMLRECAQATALQSIEEPFKHKDQQYLKMQQALFERYGVPFVADESVCSMEDAWELKKAGGFQIINLRIGKNAGLWASTKLRNFADQHQIGLVCGSMVGETGILTQASELFLQRSTQFDYVEGLGQNNWLLKTDPVDRCDPSNCMSPFNFKEDACQHLIKRTMAFT